MNVAYAFHVVRKRDWFLGSELRKTFDLCGYLFKILLPILQILNINLLIIYSNILIYVPPFIHF